MPFFNIFLLRSLVVLSFLMVNNIDTSGSYLIVNILYVQLNHPLLFYMLTLVNPEPLIFTILIGLKYRYERKDVKRNLSDSVRLLAPRL